MVVRWTFDDPSTLESYVLHINPSEHTPPTRERTITQRSSAAPDGQAIIMEGRPPVGEHNWSGVILTQAQYEALDAWSSPAHPGQIQVTDDLGRQWWIIITKFAPVRKRSTNYRWRHDFTITALVLDWPGG